MLRLLIAATCALLLLAMGLDGVDRLQASRHPPPLAPTVSDPGSERARWLAVQPDSLAGRDLRQEALTVLAMLERLEAQRRELQDFYLALSQGLQVTEEYREERIASERRLAEQEAGLAAWRRRVERLRPQATTP